MKSNRSLYEIAARVLAEDARASTGASQAARADAVRAITGAMRARKRRRQVRWVAIGAVAASAAAAALVLGLGRTGRPPAVVAGARSAPPPAAAASFVRGEPSVLRHGRAQPLEDGAPLEVGDRVLVQPGSRATVALPRGTYLAVDEHAELLFAASVPATTFELVAGSVRADVAKLDERERFLVRTPDAEIEVHGTSFEVSLVPSDAACGDGARTRVRVREGTVAVRARGVETLVSAGGTWPTGCKTPTDVGPSTAEPATAPAETASAAARSPAPPRGEAPAPASDLARENDLYERALSRSRAGDARGAVALFDELLARYPNGHLAQTARAERMKALRDVDPGRARDAARDYLRRYPSGFARRDAELILSAD